MWSIGPSPLSKPIGVVKRCMDRVVPVPNRMTVDEVGTQPTLVKFLFVCTVPRYLIVDRFLVD